MESRYREPDVMERLAAQETALAVANERQHALERELYATRKILRRRREFSAARTSGFGALGGTLAGVVGWALTGNAWLIVFGSVLLTLFTFIIAYVWFPVEDGFEKGPST